MRKLFFIHLVLFIFLALCAKEQWPGILLLFAQLVFIPLMFLAIVEDQSAFKKIYPFIALPAYMAIVWMSIFPSNLNGPLSIIYFLFTIYIALYGVVRFIHRGFIQLEEFVIDCGFLFLSVGGMWFLAYEFGMDTGFSPLITWLTAIHFHYSAFLMLVFIGLLGRLKKGPIYPYIASSMIVLPWVMAAGITLSPWIELIGIILYIMVVYALIIYSFKLSYASCLQKLLVTIAFSSIGVTIVFACLYIFSHSFQYEIVTIQWMLVFHGLTNTILFGLIGSIGWLLAVPSSNWNPPNFPYSSIRGMYRPSTEDTKIKGLVDNMNIYAPFIQPNTIAKTVIDFYENTDDYQLHARVGWHTWFKPLAFVYRQISRFLEQINLPFSKQRVPMTGSIYDVEKDGREDVRVWMRKIGKETVFVALYSFHEKEERTYMNIALPLPFTSMHGILALNQDGEALELTSERKNATMQDAGIYLVFGKGIRFRLPLSETFYVEEVAEGRLEARHKMRIIGIPFLTICYEIEHR